MASRVENRSPWMHSTFMEWKKLSAPGIIVAIAFSTHAAMQLVLLYQLLVSVGAILAATVGMDNHALGMFTFPEYHLQGISHPVSGHALIHCPTHHLTGE